MKRKIGSALVILSIAMLVMPLPALAQNRRDRCDYRGIARRDKNGFRFGDNRVGLFDGPGIINYEHRNRWMDSPAGAAAVIGIGAGAGAATGAIVDGKNPKKGALVGALIGGAAATGVWLYKNRTVKRRIF